MGNFIKRHLDNLNTGYPPFAVKIVKYEEHDYQKEKKIPILNIVLLVLTFITTTIAGANAEGAFWNVMISGLPYSIAIIIILLSHEMGHYFAAKRFGVRATLPYFIPFPSLFGTMGAVIKTKSPIPDRRALFYIGTMGPLSGFVVSLIAVIIGIYLSEIKPVPVPSKEILIPVMGDSLLFKFLVWKIHGTMHPGYDLYLSGIAWAGWIGFFVTSLNLIPIGQLDGGHILYSLIGRKQVCFGWCALCIIICLAFVWPGWIVWIVLSLVLFMIAHPAVPDSAPLSTQEKALGWFCMSLLIFTFIPIPVYFIE